MKYRFVGMTAAIGFAISTFAGATEPLGPDGRPAQLHHTVTWVGSNGVAFKGRFQSMEDGKIVVWSESHSRSLRLDKSNLSEQTRAWFERAWADEEALRGGGAAMDRDPSNHDPLADGGYAPLPPEGYMPIEMDGLKREDIPALEGVHNHIQAFAAFFAWWDAHSNFEIPRGSDTRRKTDWVIGELDRYFKKRNGSALHSQDIAEGFEKFFGREYADVARYFLDMRRVDLATLHRYASSGSATVLTIHYYEGEKSNGWGAMSLLSADPGGRVTLGYLGNVLRGRLVEDADGFEFHAADDETVEAMRGYRLRVEDVRWNSQLYILTPFVKAPAEEGEKDAAP